MLPHTRQSGETMISLSICDQYAVSVKSIEIMFNNEEDETYTRSIAIVFYVMTIVFNMLTQSSSPIIVVILTFTWFSIKNISVRFDLCTQRP